MHRAVVHTLFGVAAVLIVGTTASAKDPMRPLGADASTPVIVPSTTPTTAPVTPSATTPAPSNVQVQATRRAAEGHWEALIDRQWRRAGDRFGGASVAEVHGDRVVLLRGSRREAVWLFPPLTPSRANAARP
jgi:hypothetical protein